MPYLSLILFTTLCEISRISSKFSAIKLGHVNWGLGPRYLVLEFVQPLWPVKCRAYTCAYIICACVASSVLSQSWISPEKMPFVVEESGKENVVPTRESP
ncbi:hypothetical protein GBAR_LOCUS8036 [Geodia barretti]|uniref:Uncharacterized protein n=1 Tax=Geodia barretti TaxID=519541 RepID=A0AA35RL14_GEOBA|nr:hypothetical protein GBAR_LOCUS8036 [Geodia barretti]